MGKKKLILLSLITIMSFKIVAQKLEIGMGGVADYFSQRSACEMFNVFEKDGMGSAFLENTFSFVTNGKQYLVSYDNTNMDTLHYKLMLPKYEIVERNLYLYRLDTDGWKIAVDKPLKIDFEKEVGYPGIRLCDYYYPLYTMDGLNAGASFQEDGTVKLDIIIMYNELSNLKKTKYRIHEVELLPLSDGNYQVKANANKKSDNTNQIDLMANTINTSTGTFKDLRDGRTYKTVKIGNQTWMAENLAFKASEGCWAYNNDENNAKFYGYLYNWETAREGCPSGWHLPSLKEWDTLIAYVGKKQFTQARFAAGSSLKEVGFKHWDTLYGEDLKAKGTNDFGFTALPGGSCSTSGESFDGIGWQGLWWVNTNYNTSQFAYYYRIHYAGKGIMRDYSIVENGLSVRCIKD
jgi:uncharacterized protein (TIGR02145 family)